MNTETYSEGEYDPAPAQDEPIFTSSGMFAGSQHFTIGGGTFNNSTNHYHLVPAELPDFRMVPMGDIDLQQELIMNKESWAVGRRRKRTPVRRVYSAKLEGRSTALTVAVYQGEGAEEDWRRDVETHMSVRHPNILQIYGTASSGAMYATIFHDDLIPIQPLVASSSPIMTVYIYACYVGGWEVCEYVEESQHICKSIQMDFRYRSTVSIRRSNGRLCADFVSQSDLETRANQFFPPLSDIKYHPPINPSLGAASQEAAAIESLTLKEYDLICLLSLSRCRSGSLSSFAAISSAAVFFLPLEGQFEEGAEIASLPETEITDLGWALGKERWSGMLMANEWTRFNAKDVCNGALAYTVKFPIEHSAWPAQANHIFSRLQITTNLEDYHIWLSISLPREGLSDRADVIKRPNCPAYWSLDPFGAERLSTEEATRLGFPALRLDTEIEGCSWNASVYAGLRQFHEGKGFDPESQDIALRLGEPLYQLVGDRSPPFAHGDSDLKESGAEDNIRQVEARTQPQDAPSNGTVANGEAKRSVCPADCGHNMAQFATAIVIHRLLGIYATL
ncbi:hypothetical protein C8F04DRAFT_1338578 [Mycena alexandri]|uniref:Protein kinase domain-containing protein n=1 Tax=Mycena alexandri TaxID=1745969 RepID=A0AAD6RYR8_9AGAR|nr:hypothetical protein C8F04DRAFT_1338578 [Mycena alexandri]